MQHITSEHIRQISRGDENAFQELFNAFYPKLVGLAVKYCNDIMTAEDIVSEVFKKIWGRKEHLSEVGSFESFLSTSVRNSVLNHIRNKNLKEKHHHTMCKNMTDEAFEELEFEEDIHYRLYNAIAQLPEQGRKIFELSVLNGWKDKEIAEDLNISINTVKTHKKRAFKDLRSKLGKYYIFLFFYLPLS